MLGLPLDVIKHHIMPYISPLDREALRTSCKAFTRLENEELKKLQAGDADTLRRALRKYARKGCKDMVEFLCTNKKVTDMNNGLYGAVAGNHLNLARYFIEKAAGAVAFSGALYEAARCAQQSAVEFIIEKSLEQDHKLDYDRGFIGAIIGGDKDIITIFLAQKIDPATLNHALFWAAHENSSTAIHLIEEYSRGQLDWTQGFKGAARAGNIKLLQYFANKGANCNCEHAELLATLGGHRALFKDFLQLL